MSQISVVSISVIDITTAHSLPCTDGSHCFDCRRCCVSWLDMLSHHFWTNLFCVNSYDHYGIALNNKIHLLLLHPQTSLYNLQFWCNVPGSRKRAKRRNSVPDGQIEESKFLSGVRTWMIQSTPRWVNQLRVGWGGTQQTPANSWIVRRINPANSWLNWASITFLRINSALAAEYIRHVPLFKIVIGITISKNGTH